MWFHKFCMATLAVIVASACAHAQELSISFHDPAFPSVHNIQWNPASPSPAMVIGIENPSLTTDKLYGWQLGLRIEPDVGATGKLQFSTATLPPSYLLDGRSDGLTRTLFRPTDTIPVIGDTDSLHTGVLVPSSGANLLQVDFVAWPGTSGVFDIMAVPDLFNGCNWYSDDSQARYYANVPFDEGEVCLGTVNVSVPEPSTVLLLLSGSLAIGMAACRRWARNGRER